MDLNEIKFFAGNWEDEGDPGTTLTEIEDTGRYLMSLWQSKFCEELDVENLGEGKYRICCVPLNVFWEEADADLHYGDVIEASLEGDKYLFVSVVSRSPRVTEWYSLPGETDRSLILRFLLRNLWNYLSENGAHAERVMGGMFLVSYPEKCPNELATNVSKRLNVMIRYAYYKRSLLGIFGLGMRDRLGRPR